MKKECGGFLDMCIEDWPDSKEHLLSSKLSQLVIMYTDWRSNFRARLTNLLKSEAEDFKRQDRQRRERVQSMFQMEDEDLDDILSVGGLSHTERDTEESGKR